MGNYVIFTDSACDLEPEYLSELGVKMAPLTFRLSDSEREFLDTELDYGIFYKRMRGGEGVKTSAVNCAYFKKKFTEILDTGCDILYLGLSSAISTTYNSARLAAEELRDEAPKRKIITVDTHSASAGLGLIVYLTVKEKEKGASIDDAADFARSIAPKVCHWFTVEDLGYLKRGGRISSATAYFGNMLGIKPVLYMDDDGLLKSHSKAIGRHASIEALAKKYGELACDKTENTVFISHGDAISDAKLLERMLAEKYGTSVKMITSVGCVIGGHSGPGTLALFFIGKDRKGD